MNKYRLIISLMVLVAVIIVGLAVYVFTHLSGLTQAQGFSLIGVAVLGLILVMAILLMLVRNINARRK
jgi:hypothetical protein